MPDVLCLHSEVVLWNFLSVQMFFWWICWGEKVVSPSYPSAILGLPPRYGFYSCFRKILWRRKWQPTAVFLPGKSLGQSLTGYWAHTHIFIRDSRTVTDTCKHRDWDWSDASPSKECLEAGRSKEHSLLEPQRSAALQTPGFRTSGLPGCFKPPSLF